MVVSLTKPWESMLEEFGDCVHEFNIPGPENQVQFENLNLLLCNGLCTCVAGHASFVVICDFIIAFHIV